jgi:hypothetical protein
MSKQPRPTVSPTMSGILFVEVVEGMPMPLVTTLTEDTGNPPKVAEELSPEARVDEAALTADAEVELVVSEPEASTEFCLIELKVIESA